MILVIAPSEVPGQTLASPAVRIARQEEASVDTVLSLLDKDSFEQIVVAYPSTTLNPFALARAVRHRHGPPVVLAGAMPPHARYWAERNGCQTAPDLQSALEPGGTNP